MKTPITPLRLRSRYRGFLERIADQTGRSMAEVVMHLLDGAIAHPERWPRRIDGAPPRRGKQWHKDRARGQASIAPDDAPDDAPSP